MTSRIPGIRIFGSSDLLKRMVQKPFYLAVTISFMLFSVAAAVKAGDELSGVDIESLSISELQSHLQKRLSGAPVSKLTVTWTGLLKPPYTGSYRLFVSPINVNQSGPFPAEHRVISAIRGQVVLDTSPELQETIGDGEKPRRRAQSRASMSKVWNWEGQPFKLEAGVSVPVKVTMTYSQAGLKEREKEFWNISNPSALLFWEGPTLDRQIVGRSFLSNGEGKAGLKAEFCWTSEAGKRVVVQQTESIDFAWPSVASAVANNYPLVAELTDRLYELATSSSYLQNCITGKTQHIFFSDSACTDYLSSAQRQGFLQQLIDRPQLLERISQDQLPSVYQRFRPGAEEQAVDFLGHWLSLRPDITPEISANFFRDNRQVYWKLALLLAQQSPELVETLKEGYLETAEGMCVLPVAYTLAYCYRAQPVVLPVSATDSMPEIPALKWLEFLNEQLDDQSIAGNLRVNWLIAKAQAVESRNPIGVGFAFPKEDYLSGRDWLAEAQLVAEEPTVQQQVFAERIARLAAQNRDWKVRELLNAAEVAVHRQQLQVWKRATDAIVQQREVRSIADKESSRSAHIQTLQNRREHAAQQGAEQAVTRYDRILQQLEVTPNK